MARKSIRKPKARTKGTRTRKRKGAASAEPPDVYPNRANRKNSAEAGSITYEVVKGGPPPKQYEYDPRVDPHLMWAGKAEHTSFEVHTVSLHIRARVQGQAMIGAVGGSLRSAHMRAGPHCLPASGFLPSRTRTP